MRWRPAESPHQSDPCNGGASTGASSLEHCSYCRYSFPYSGSSNSSGSRFKISTRIAVHHPGGIPLPFHTFAVAARPAPTGTTTTAKAGTVTSKFTEIERDKAASFASVPRAPLLERVGGTATVVEEEECGGGSRRSRAGGDDVVMGDKEARGYGSEMGLQQKDHLQQYLQQRRRRRRGKQEGLAGKTIEDADGVILEGRGVLIRFHSTVAGEGEDVVGWRRSRSVDAAVGMAGGEWSQQQQQQYPHRRRVEPGEEGTGTIIDRQATDRQFSDLTTGTEGVPVHDKTPTAQRYDLPIAERPSAEAGGLAAKTHGRTNRTPCVEASTTKVAVLPEGSSSSAVVKGVRDGAKTMASLCALDGDRQDVLRGWGRKGSIERRPTVLPRRFSYSLVAPFHSQRVTCVKFLAPPASTPRSGSAEERHNSDDELPGLRLVTGKCW